MYIITAHKTSFNARSKIWKKKKKKF